MWHYNEPELERQHKRAHRGCLSELKKVLLISLVLRDPSSVVLGLAVTRQSREINTDVIMNCLVPRVEHKELLLILPLKVEPLVELGILLPDWFMIMTALMLQRKLLYLASWVLHLARKAPRGLSQPTQRARYLVKIKQCFSPVSKILVIRLRDHCAIGSK